MPEFGERPPVEDEIGSADPVLVGLPVPAERVFEQRQLGESEWLVLERVQVEGRELAYWYEHRYNYQERSWHRTYAGGQNTGPRQSERARLEEDPEQLVAALEPQATLDDDELNRLRILAVYLPYAPVYAHQLPAWHAGLIRRATVLLNRERRRRDEELKDRHGHLVGRAVEGSDALTPEEWHELEDLGNLFLMDH